MTNIRRNILITCALALGLLAIGLGFATARMLLLPTAYRESNSAIGGPFTLQTTDGRAVTDRTFRGKWLVVFFGYTNCPDDCPIALADISGALKKLGPEAAKAQPLFITVDPKRDTLSVLADYLKSFDPRIIGLRGSDAQTASAMKAYRVYYSVHHDNGDDELIDHSDFVYVMDRTGKFAKVFSGRDSGDVMATQLRELMD